MPKSINYLIGSALILASAAAYRRTTFNHKQITAAFASNTSTSTTATTRTMATQVKLTQNEKKSAKIWNRFAEGYSKQPIADEQSYQKKLSITREYLSPDKQVLEFGCGTGGTALLHAPYVKHIHAIDFSSKMIEIAKGKAASEGVKNVDFEVQGIDSLSPSEKSYDVVLGLSVLHLVPDRDDTLRTVHKLVKPGGYFVSSTVCIGDFASFFRYIGPIGRFFGVLPDLQIFTTRELKQSLTAAGFEIEREFQPAKDKGIFLVAKKK